MPGASLPAHLATTRRGGALEAIVRGHVVVVDAAGRSLAVVGDGSAVTTLRSCVKPLQALPFVRRAADAIGATDDDVAVACASHSGEPVHVLAVRALIARAAVPEAALACGPQLPSDAGAAAALLRSGEAVLPVHNNCSGKHAAMLATCRVAGWPIDGYTAWDHPLQAEVRGILGELAGVDVAAAPWGVDGCGLPTHQLPLTSLARAFAAAGGAEGFARCQRAMAARPDLVAGSGRFDTALLGIAGETLTAKVGGAAVWVARRRSDGPALAIKLEAGDATALPAIALAALRALGWVDDDQLAQGPLQDFVEPKLRNWAGEVVGATVAEDAWIGGLAA